MQGLAELIAWREAASLAGNCAAAAAQMKGIAVRAAAEQLVRSAESIAANIAEGYGRGVNQDCIRFCKIARGSTQEVESHLTVALLSKRLPEEVVNPLIDQVRRVRYLINRFIQSVERRMKSRA